MCGSFCTVAKSLEQLKLLINAGYDVQPIVSETVFSTDTRFTVATELADNLEKICGRELIHTIVDAEPLGPSEKLDALIICPCTGNTCKACQRHNRYSRLYGSKSTFTQRQTSDNSACVK